MCLNFFYLLNCLNGLAFVNLTLNMLLKYYSSHFINFPIFNEKLFIYFSNYYSSYID